MREYKRKTNAMLKEKKKNAKLENKKNGVQSQGGGAAVNKGGVKIKIRELGSRRQAGAHWALKTN